MKYAIKSFGAGKKVDARRVPASHSGADFYLPEHTDFTDMVLSEDLVSLRKKTKAEKDQEKEDRKDDKAGTDKAMLETIASLTNTPYNDVKALYKTFL